MKYQESDFNLLKLDICALLRAIDEIENRVKMRKILQKTQTNSKKPNAKQIASENKNIEKFVRFSFAMLNFSRNYTALEYVQKDPSDQRTKLV